MNFNLNGSALTIFLSDRIDSSNADERSAQMEKILSENAHESVILDVEALEYISSAGLRAVLKVRKANPDTKIINASTDVYEIFDMTGFTEMMTVEKAYRRLSVEGCEVIGKGANGEVYRLDPDTIIKVYYNPDSLPDIQRERELARKAFVLGIPTAIPYDVVRVGDGYGSVFELLNAKSFAKLIASEPENLDKYIKLYVDLMKTLHSTEVKKGDMPDMKEVALGWADFLRDHLPAEQADKLYALIKAVPDSCRMMHGDYHIKNVMMQNDEVLLIDMDTLCMGHPVFELASVFLAYKGFSENDHTAVEKFMGITRDVSEKIWDDTLRLYFETDDPEKLKEYEDKAKVIGYARMLRRSIRRNAQETELGRKDIAMCKERLADLLGRIDTLDF